MCKGNINQLSGTPQLPHNPGMCSDEIELVAFQFVGQHPTHRATPFRQGTFVRHFSKLSGEILLWRTGSWDQEVQLNMRTRITALEGLTCGGGKPRHRCLHVHNTAQRLVLWRKLIQDESLGISVRGGAVWQVVPKGSLKGR